MLYAIAHCCGVFEISWGNRIDALFERRIDAQRYAKGQGCKNHQLVGGIGTVDVKGGIRLGVSEGLRFCQHVRKFAAFGAHLGQYEIAGAVNDPRHFGDLIRGHCLSKCFDNRDAASD